MIIIVIISDRGCRTIWGEGDFFSTESNGFMTNFSIDNLSHPNLHSFHRPWRIVEFLYNVICRWYIMEICYFCRKTKYKSSSNNLNVCFLSQKCFLTSCFETQYTKLWKMSLCHYLPWPFYTVWKTKDGNWKNSRFG